MFQACVIEQLLRQSVVTLHIKLDFSIIHITHYAFDLFTIINVGLTWLNSLYFELSDTIHILEVISVYVHDSKNEEDSSTDEVEYMETIEGYDSNAHDHEKDDENHVKLVPPEFGTQLMTAPEILNEDV